MKTKSAVALVFLLTIGRLYAQTICCPYINSITTIPTNPTTLDTIKIVTSTTTPNVGSRISYTHTQQSDTFHLVGCFWGGLATALTTFYDTTHIGQLPAGTYFVDYLAYLSTNPTSCSVVDTNSMTASFVVAEPTDVKTSHSSDNVLSVYPNPFSVQTVLQFNTYMQNATLNVSNYLGQTVKQINHASGRSVILHREDLPSGLHFVQVMQDDRVIGTKKLIIID